MIEGTDGCIRQNQCSVIFAVSYALRQLKIRINPTFLDSFRKIMNSQVLIIIAAILSSLVLAPLLVEPVHYLPYISKLKDSTDNSIPILLPFTQQLDQNNSVNQIESNQIEDVNETKSGIEYLAVLLTVAKYSDHPVPTSEQVLINLSIRHWLNILSFIRVKENNEYAYLRQIANSIRYIDNLDCGNKQLSKSFYSYSVTILTIYEQFLEDLMQFLNDKVI